MPDLDRIADRKLAASVLDGGRLRALVLELWQRTRMDWGFVTDRLATTFRKETWIGAHDRRFVSETLYGLVRHLRRVDLAITRGRRAAKPPRDLERLIALLVLEGLVDPARAAQVLPDLDWSAVATVDQAITAERKLAPRIALAASLPDWLAARFVADWGDAAEPLALALNQRAPMTVRANLLVGDRAALAAELSREGLTTHAGKWSDTAIVVDSRTNLFGLAAFKRGALEAQDEGSQLLADLVATCASSPRPIVVDYCAGAGGKTLAVAARLGNRGRIFATDIDGGKLEELRRRARRAQVSNAQAIAIEGGRWPAEIEALRGKADVVFIDAPCSGIGALRRNPEARWRLQDADLVGFATRQQQIITAAKDLCAPGGYLVYATCTLLRVENQDVIASALAAHSELAAVPLAELASQPISDGESLMVTPHVHGTDGFFASVMRRHR